jgi:hypothetical protein
LQTMHVTKLMLATFTSHLPRTAAECALAKPLHYFTAPMHTAVVNSPG